MSTLADRVNTAIVVLQVSPGDDTGPLPLMLSMVCLQSIGLVLATSLLLTCLIGGIYRHAIVKSVKQVLFELLAFQLTSRMINTPVSTGSSSSSPSLTPSCQSYCGAQVSFQLFLPKAVWAHALYKPSSTPSSGPRPPLSCCPSRSNSLG